MENKINFNGLYKHEPDSRYSKYDDLYHCQNWIFKPHTCEEKIYMWDTYLSSGYPLTIELTDENINEFSLLFDFDDVKETEAENLEEFGERDKDWFVFPVESAGLQLTKKYILKSAKRDKEMVINRERKKIESLREEIKSIENIIVMLQNGEIEPKEWM